MPEVRRGRSGRAQGAEGEYLLGLHELSKVRLYFEFEAGGTAVPRVQESVSCREDAAVGGFPRMPEQEEGSRGRDSAEEAGRKGCGEGNCAGGECSGV